VSSSSEDPIHLDTFDIQNNTLEFYTKDAQLERGSDFQYKITLKGDYLVRQVIHLVQGAELSVGLGLIP
jgi:hypothetical protein